MRRRVMANAVAMRVERAGTLPDHQSEPSNRNLKEGKMAASGSLSLPGTG
jgi:hypothetical protein